MSGKKSKAEVRRAARHVRVRKKINGTASRPRLCVHRSLNHMFAQVVDDTNQKVLFGVSTQNKELRAKLKNCGNIPAASILGQTLAAMAIKAGIQEVAFDRGGYLYHGRVKAFAQAAREGGLKF